MNKLNRIFSIVKKDMFEAFRNKTILIVILLPLTASLLFSLVNNSDLNRSFKIGVSGESYDFVEFLDFNVENLIAEEYSSTLRAEEEIKRGLLDGLVIIEKDYYGEESFRVFLDSNQALDYLFLKSSIEEVIESYLNLESDLNLEFIPVSSPEVGLSFLPVWLSIVITMIGVLIISGNLAEEKENRTLDSLFISPAGKGEMLLGKILSGIIFTFITTLLMCVVNGALVVGWYHFTLLMLIIICGAAGFTSMGLLIGALTDSQSAARALGTVFYFPLLFPTLIYNLSEFTRKLAHLFPTFYLYKGIEKVLIYRVNLSELRLEISVLMSFAVIFYVLTYFAFKKVRD